MKILTIAFGCFLAASALHAEITLKDSGDKKISLSGMAAIQEGQYINAIYKQRPSSYRQWVNNTFLNIRLDTYLAEKRLRIIVMPEVKLWSNTYPVYENQPLSSNPYYMYAKVSIADGEGVYSFGDPDKPFLQFAAGVMPVKYNQNAKNLGEYLFRTGTHPAHIVTEFDYPFAILTGLRLSSMPVENLRIDLLLHTETEINPLFDWSPSLLLGYTFLSMVDIGGGVCFDRLFSANGDLLTMPKNSQNAYYTVDGEQKYYRFGGTKLMGRIGIDPKAIVPSAVSKIFGREDGKLYAEVAALGLDNTKPYVYQRTSLTDSILVPDTNRNYYANLMERIPIMFGFNIPAFKFLDVLSTEFEWYGWRYRNSFGDYAFDYTLPIPRPASGMTPSAYKHDNWKFSVYARKTVVDGFTVLGQIARDHTRHDVYIPAFREEEEIFTLLTSYGWWLKLQYSF